MVRGWFPFRGCLFKAPLKHDTPIYPTSQAVGPFGMFVYPDLLSLSNRFDLLPREPNKNTTPRRRMGVCFLGYVHIFGGEGGAFKAC